MLLCVLFVLSSIAIGFAAVTALKPDQIQFFNRFFLAWICGPQISGVILFITTYFHRITVTHLLLVSAFEVITSVIILFKISYKVKITQVLQFEKSYLFYLSLITPLLLCLPYLINVYQNLPYRIPGFFISIYESEQSFVSSILHGANSLRDNFLHFQDPNCIGSFYPDEAFPLLFISGCSVLGCPYNVSSLFVCIMNLLSTSSFLFFYSSQFTKPQNRFLFVICFVFNGGIQFFSELCNCDVTNVFDSFKWYQTTAHLLTFSKTSSFAIPFCIITLSFLQNKDVSKSDLHLTVFLSIITPNFMCSLCLYLISSCYSKSLKLYIKFIPMILLKFFISDNNLSVNPLWKELQMNGVYCSQFIVCVIFFGIPFVVLVILLMLNKFKSLLKLFVPNIASFLFLCFIRNGNDHFNNIVAISSVFLPQLLLIFTIIIGRFITYKSNDKTLVGALRCFALFIYITYVFGGSLVMLNTFNNSITLVRKSDIEIADVIQKVSHQKSVFLAKQKVLSPISLFAGRQIILSNFTSAWKRNANVRTAMTILNKVESNGDCVDIMKKLQINFLLEMKNNKLCANVSEMKLIAYNDEWELYFMQK